MHNLWYFCGKIQYTWKQSTSINSKVCLQSGAVRSLIKWNCYPRVVPTAHIAE